jgi:hypothetical protein
MLLQPIAMSDLFMAIEAARLVLSGLQAGLQHTAILVGNYATLSAVCMSGALAAHENHGRKQADTAALVQAARSKGCSTFTGGAA